MADNKRKFESEALGSKPLTLKKAPRQPADAPGKQPPAAGKLVLPESRDLVLRLITKIKEQ